MNIRINGKKHKVKPASILTAKEYIELSKIESPNITDYLKIVSRETFGSIMNIRANKTTLRRLHAFVGTVKNSKELINDRKRYFVFKNKAYNIEKIDCETLGCRLMIENKSKQTQNIYELSLYLLSIVVVDNYDSEQADSVYCSLLDLGYLDVLPPALFFFRKLTNGYSFGTRLLSRISEIFTTNMRLNTKQ